MARSLNTPLFFSILFSTLSVTVALTIDFVIIGALWCHHIPEVLAFFYLGIWLKNVNFRARHITYILIIFGGGLFAYIFEASIWFYQIIIMVLILMPVFIGYYLQKYIIKKEKRKPHVILWDDAGVWLNARKYPEYLLSENNPHVKEMDARKKRLFKKFKNGSEKD